MATSTQPALASEMRSPAERSPGTASSSAVTRPKNTARLMTPLRSERVRAASSPRLSSALAGALGWSCGAAMRIILTRSLAEAGRRQAVAAAEGAREVRRLPVAHQARHVRDGDRRLLDQKRRRGRHPPREQVLVEALLAELRVGALELSRRAGQ